jgi:hypothetical protein
LGFLANLAIPQRCNSSLPRLRQAKALNTHNRLFPTPLNTAPPSPIMPRLRRSMASPHPLRPEVKASHLKPVTGSVSRGSHSHQLLHQKLRDNSLHPRHHNKERLL